MTRRERHPQARTWHSEAPEPIKRVAPVEQITDPALRAIFLARRRALLGEIAEIERRCGLDPDAPDGEAA